MTRKPGRKSRNLPCGRPAQASKAKPRAARDTWRERLSAHFGSQGLRNSEARWKVAELALGSGDHLDAQDLVARVRSKHPGIGAATVYRTLKVLCEAGLLRESLRGSGNAVLYEPQQEEHHDHIVCGDCGAIFEFHDEKIEIAQEVVSKAMGFQPTHHDHVIYAHCTYLD